MMELGSIYNMNIAKLVYVVYESDEITEFDELKKEFVLSKHVIGVFAEESDAIDSVIRCTREDDKGLYFNYDVYPVQ